MIAIVRIVISLLFHDEGAALARTAPEPLDVDIAAEHYVDSRIAAARYRVDPDLLLAVVARESHYRDTCEMIDVDRGHVEGTCGARRPSLLVGYMRVAEHVRAWMVEGGLTRTSERREQLIGLAGGHALVVRCRVGPVVDERGRDLCVVSWRDLWTRAAWIRRERTRGARS